MICSDFRMFYGSTISALLQHSAKGTEWKKHKYVIKKAGKYYYPDSYEGGRHASNLQAVSIKRLMQTNTSGSGPKTENKETSKEESKNLSKDDVERLAKAVIRGNYGNGQDRKDALGDNYQQIQNRVNEILLGSSKSNTKISEVTKEAVEKVTSKAKSSGGIDLDTVYKVYKEKEKNK